MGVLLFSNKFIFFLISNKVNIKRYSSHQLKLFGILDDLKCIKGWEEQKNEISCFGHFNSIIIELNND